jgi:hypothetical protein
MIYIACPYTDDSSAVMEARYGAVTRYAGELMKIGVLVYSPITHNHPIAKMCTLPRGWEFWAGYDMAMLGKSSQMIVLTLDGWEESKGLRHEVEFCNKYKIPVTYVCNPYV